MKFFCKLSYLHPLNSEYSLRYSNILFPFCVCTHCHVCFVVQNLPLLDIHQHASDAILFFSFLPAIFCISLCSKEQSYSGNDSFPRSHLSTFLCSRYFCSFRRSENTKHGLHLTRCWVELIFSSYHAVHDRFAARRVIWGNGRENGTVCSI